MLVPVLTIVVLAVAALVFVISFSTLVSIVTALIGRELDEAVVRHGVEDAPAYRSKVTYALLCVAIVPVMFGAVIGSLYVATLPWLLLPDRPGLLMRLVQVFGLFIPVLVFEWLLLARLSFRSRAFTRFWVKLSKEPSR